MYNSNFILAVASVILISIGYCLGYIVGYRKGWDDYWKKAKKATKKSMADYEERKRKWG